jgi:hypothetical protein
MKEWDSVPAISAEERAKRQRAMDFARGSVRYEGFILSIKAEQIGKRFVAGHLTLADYIAAIKALGDIEYTSDGACTS